ncbi:MAG: DNA primase [Trichodesmium sp. St16_bin4-tuft]|nr:DNA primase [Trichodesmium sp. St4_bin8_1]MDE5077997.1 DNA primase [Trichodesmium sp. St2_bin6]MDE5090345.1 DNA primase [Trichodesmium sp. St18_bin3_1_1]MDE5100278.1 DNA primase [Trichodesmium sp. St16_bin4-tuft]MDE5105318.1 DNA primase [Trichodesmium sp. St19_bin2]
MNNFRFHQDTITEVKERADIYDVISEHLLLKKRGKDYVGLCPFHEEKTPSFTVSTTKQLYYCFGCGAAGNVLKFLMEIGKSSFSDVVLDLARRYQIPIKTELPENRQEFQRQISLREKLYEILAIANSFYQHALRQPQGKIALEYLQISRQTSEETIQNFQLGYAPNGWETIYGYLVEQKGLPIELVEKAGLILSRKSGTGYYDRFRDRLMIPINDIQGRVIGFGGRTLSDEQPKYLNSPETELFDKGKTLFALDKAKTAISKQDKAVVVEGYFDAIALHASGINNVVASLGTALSSIQIRQLLRYTESKQIILNFDADRAGIQATERAIGEMEKFAYSGEVQLRILKIPDGKDADEYLKTYSGKKYQELLVNSTLWIDWQIQNIVRSKNLSLADEYTKASQEIVKILTKITNDNQFTYYLQYCAQILSQEDTRRVSLIYENLLTQVFINWKKILAKGEFISPPLLVAKQLKSNQRNNRNFTKGKKNHSPEVLSPPVKGSLLAEAESLLLRIYLHCPNYRREVKDAMEARDLQFSFAHNRLLWQQIVSAENISENEINQSDDLISKLQDTYWENLDKFPNLKHLFHLDEKTKKNILRAPLEIRSSVATIELIISKKRQSTLLNMWQETDLSVDPELAEKYKEKFYSESQWIQELERLRLTTIQDLIEVPLGELTN